MRIRVGCEFDYVSEAPVPLLMLVRPQPTFDHRIEYESRWTDPELGIRDYRDVFGNTGWRFTAPGGAFQIRYDALIATSDAPDVAVPGAPLLAVDDLPDDSLVFTLPSRYIESDLLAPIGWQLFGDLPPTWARVQAICDWVHANIAYIPGSSGPGVTAMDIYQRRVGVCRDFALLAIGLCRAVNIPARYAFGYLPDIGVEPPDTPMDFHAWFEAYVGDRWYAFDARHNIPRIGRIIVGRGRDAVDVAMVTQYGAIRLDAMTVWAEEVFHTQEPAPDADELEAAELTPRSPRA
jgi:transglutaminase-like putative cysteine protease